MLKNLKVGTKLVAILVAPVLVLVALAYVGVRGRLNDASDAQRVQQLTQFVETNAILVRELQLEAMQSALFTATSKDKSLDVANQRLSAVNQQRAKTDAALANFTEQRTAVDPGRDAKPVQDALRQADTRIRGLVVNRRAVDGVQSDARTLIEGFRSTMADLTAVNRAVSQTVNDPALARSLASFVNLEAFTNVETQTASLLAVSVDVGFYARVLPTTSNDRVPAKLDAEGAGCADNAQVQAGAGQCPMYQDTVQSSTDAATADSIYIENASPAQKELKRTADAGNRFENMKKAAIEDGQNQNDLTGTSRSSVKVDSAEFMTASAERINKLYEAQRKILVDDPQSVLAVATNKATEAQRAASLSLLFTIAAVLLAALITYSVARAITGPLHRLTAAAYTLSTERLPALVERLRNPEDDGGESLAATLTPIDIKSKDEIGQLADSFNSIQQVTVEVAEEQSVLLRKGIGDIFINLARRNQTLLDRQIEFIDQLEANEEDPDQLDNLFKLDHLATRMRRNAESLLVLAGAEPPRRRGRPVALADVVRVAIGEVEDFARIQLLALDDATVGGNVAVDLAHLLSELMENATHFSPPDTMVEIVGHRADGGYIISVSDQGIGMSADQIFEANTQLARPPLVGLALSRSLGFIVIGRLAQRFGISVKLTASPSGGVTALVTLPSDLVTYEGEELPASPVELSEAPTSALSAAEAPVEDEVVILDDDIVVLDKHALPPPPARTDQPAPPTGPSEPVAPHAGADAARLDEDSLLDELVEEGMGDSDEFERGLQSILSDDGSRGAPPAPAPSPVAEAGPAPVAEPTEISRPTTVEAPAAPAPEVSVPTRPEIVVTVAEQIAAASRAEAKEAELTAAGLVKRTPKKRAPDPVAGETPNGQQPRVTGQTQRSPEEVRKMLSRYRSGLNKGRGSADAEKTDS